jgi:FdhD protein
MTRCRGVVEQKLTSVKAPPDHESYRRVPTNYRGDSAFVEGEALVIREEPLEIRIDGTPYAVVMRTPGNEIELAAGFCLTEGVVDSFSEIAAIGFCPDGGVDSENIVTVTTKPPTGGGERKAFLPSRSRVATTSCGLCGVQMIGDLAARLSVLSLNHTIPVERIIELQYLMSDQQKLSKLTRSAHATALSGIDGRLHVVREDVGRHNALDKVIGYALLHSIDPGECMVLLSGRISFDMVQKAIRASIPLVAAVSAATSLAVDLAREYNCTLIGLLRDQSMFVYTSPNRVVGTAE